MDMNNDFIDGMRDVHNPVPNRETGQISDESYRCKVNINNYQTVAQAIHPVVSLTSKPFIALLQVKYSIHIRP